MVTIKDVAKRAGVSISTVSNIINGKGAIGTEKYKRVKAAMEELDYHPSFVAQNLRNNRSRLIGIIFPHLNDPYNSLLQSIALYLSQRDYYPVVKLTESKPALEELHVRKLTGMGICGLIIVPTDPEKLHGLNLLKSKKIPLVLLHHNIQMLDCPKVFFDNRTFMFERFNELVRKRQVTSPLLIRYSEAFSSDEACMQGYQQACQHSRIPADILKVSTKASSSYSAIYSLLLKNSGSIDQIFTTDILLAEQIHDVENLIGMSVPVHVPVGENQQLSDSHVLLRPIRQKTTEAGETAASLLCKQLNKKNAENRTIMIRPPRINHNITPFQPIASPKVLRALALDCTAVTVLEKLSPIMQREVGVRIQFDKLLPNELPLAVEQELIAGNSSYDLFMIDMPWLRHLVNQGLLYDISEYIAAELVSRFPKNIQNVFFKDLKHRNIVPFFSGMQALYYRQDIFNDQDIQADFFHKYGIPLAVPRSWTEFNKICEFFTRKYNPDSPFIYGTSMSLDYDMSLVNEFYPRQWSFHGHFVDDWGMPTLNDDANYRALESLRTTYRYAYSASDISSDNLDDSSFGHLLEGRVPIVHGFANHYIPERYSNMIQSDISHKIVISHAPGKSPMLSGWALGVNHCSQHIQECVSFLKWLMTDRITINQMRLGGSMLTLSVCNNSDLCIRYPWLKLINASSFGSRSSIVYNRYNNPVDPAQLEYIIANAIRDALTSERSSREILEDAQIRLTDLLQ